MSDNDTNQVIQNGEVMFRGKYCECHNWIRDNKSQKAYTVSMSMEFEGFTIEEIKKSKMEIANKLKATRAEYGLTNYTVAKLLRTPITSINVYMGAPAANQSKWARAADEKGRILKAALMSIEENIRQVFVKTDIEWELESTLRETCLYIYRVPAIYKSFPPMIKKDIKIIANQSKG